jgi:hypothetical protein
MPFHQRNTQRRSRKIEGAPPEHLSACQAASAFFDLCCCAFLKLDGCHPNWMVFRHFGILFSAFFCYSLRTFFCVGIASTYGFPY